MRTKELAAKALISVPMFKLWRQRGLLPFESCGRMDWTDEHADLLRTMVALTANGFTPSGARLLTMEDAAKAARVLAVLEGNA